MSRHFCCCIPVRAAVFLLSLLTFLTSGAIAGVAWFVTYKIYHSNDDLFTSATNAARICIIVAGAVFTVLTLVSLMGFFGAVLRKRGLVKTFNFFGWIIFLITAAGWGLFLYVVYANPDALRNCTFTNADGATESCAIDFTTWKKIVVSIACAVELSIHLYILTVLHRYSKQLEDERGAYDIAGGRAPYFPPTAQDQGLLNPHMAQYPYADEHNRFGASAA